MCLLDRFTGSGSARLRRTVARARMRAMVRRDAADPPYAPDVPADAEPLDGLDAATLREQRGSSLVAARLARADFGGAQLPNLRLVDVRLEQCNLANLAARGATLVRLDGDNDAGAGAS